MYYFISKKIKRFLRMFIEVEERGRIDIILFGIWENIDTADLVIKI